MRRQRTFLTRSLRVVATLVAAILLSLVHVGFAAVERQPGLSLDGDWRVHRPTTYDADRFAQPPSPADAGWESLDETRTRAYRVAHYYEPGQPVWLERTFDAPADLRDGPVVIVVPNRPIVHRAMLNGQELRDISHDSYHIPETKATRAIPEDYPKFTGIEYRWERKNLPVRRLSHYESLFNHMGEDARLLVPAGTLRAGENRLTLQVWDYDHPDYPSLLGPVSVRKPTISDALVPFAYSQAVSDYEVQAVVGVKPRVPGSRSLQGEAEVYDNVGRLLRTEPVSLQTDGASVAEASIDRKSPDDYRAKVTLTSAGEQLDPQWVYFFPIVKHTGDVRTYFNLEGADWEAKVVHEPGAPSFPLEEKDWFPTYAPTTQIANDEYYLNRTVDHILLRKKFELPEDFHGERVLLRLGDSSIDFQKFGQQDPDTKVYVNGKKLGTFAFDQSTVEFDVTDVIRRSGENEVVLTPTRFVRGEMALVGVPELRIKKQWIITSVQDGTITVRTWVQNKTGRAAQATLNHRVRGRDGEALTFDRPVQVQVPAGETKMVETVQRWENPQLWSPWSPNLYELQTTVNSGGQAVDQFAERFGFREFAIDGEKIRINGEVLHLAGDNGLYKPDLYGRFDYSMIANRMRDLRKAGYNMSRESNGVSSNYWLLCDDFGFLGNYNAGPSDMGRGWVIQQPPEFFDAVNSMFTTFIDDNYNHPAIILWNYGNELPADRSEYLETQIIEALNEIKAFDPTRITTADGTHLPVDKVETINPHYAASPYYAYDMETVRNEIIPRTGPFIMEPDQRSYWERTKPLICGEYNWKHHEIGTSDYYSTLGEQQMKPTVRMQPDLEGEEPKAHVALVMGYLNERNEDTKWFRAGGISGYVLLQSGFHSDTMFEPILGTFYGHRQRFWSDQPIRQTLAVVNDSGREADIDLELRYMQDGSPRTAWRQTVTLPHGGRQLVEAEAPGIRVSEPQRVVAELVVSSGGEEISRHHRRWEIFPEDWAASPGGASVAVFDPTGFAQQLFEPLGVAVTPVRDIQQAGQLDADLLVLGEDLDPQLMTVAAESLRDYVRQGGTLLVLRQEAVKWLPFELEAQGHGSKGKHDDLTQVVMLGKTHPIFTDMLPEDVMEWGRYGTVAARDYGMVREGTMRSLVDEGSLIEVIEDRGRYLATTLEFTPENVANEPAVRKLLSNIVRYAGQDVPDPAKTLVYSGGSDERAEAMRDRFKLEADYVSDAPSSLDGYALVVLNGFDGKTPPASFAAELRRFAQGGGTVLAQSLDDPMQRWLGEALDLPMRDQAVISRRAVTLREDPLLQGIGDVHLGWWNTRKRDTYLQDKPAGNDIIRRAVLPKGGVELTYPAVLVKADVGAGQLVIDQSRWTEIDGERRFYWGKDSRPIADKYVATLLVNLGGSMDLPEAMKQVVNRAPAAGLSNAAFHSVDLSGQFNRSRADAKPGDGAGWIDLGPGFQLDDVPAGRQTIAGIPFVIADESTGSGKSVVALRGAERLADQPAATDNIPVGRKADALLFLHTTAYATSAPGVVLWEYVVQYEGFGEMIYGSDVSEYISVAPVRAKLDVDDWLTDEPAVTPAFTTGVDAHGKPEHLYVLRWDNPRPDVKIESIQIRSKLQSETPMIFAITAASRQEATFPAGQFGSDGKTDTHGGGSGFPAGWTAHKSWMKSNFKVDASQTPAVLRVSEYGIIRSELPVDDAWKEVQLSARVRAVNVKGGEKPWDTPRVVLSFLDSRGENIASAKLVIREDVPTPQRMSETVSVPAGARKAVVEIAWKGSSGEIELSDLRVEPVQ